MKKKYMKDKSALMFVT